ncbi:Armadillo-like helical [Penicillium chermesinum]|uniref:Armadillo-like helical n=1 Tax=Penicillium chermesinum TaxID=63820 RepID=A0A9W9P919_9EURO|nr:Armadillo-like helical [Penicillium chermesinum]KAJ5238692.1 Armadillo-like helical [Penicillium chermesinum]
MVQIGKEVRFSKDTLDPWGLALGREASSRCHLNHPDQSVNFEAPKLSDPSISSIETESPSSKKQKVDQGKVDSTTARPSGFEKIPATLPSKGSPIHSEAEESSGSLQKATVNEIRPSTSHPRPSDSCDSEDKATELVRLKQQLLAANSKIALQEQELAQTRVIKHTLDQALGPPSEADFGGREITEQTISHLQNAFNSSQPTFGQMQDAWNSQEDSQSDISDALSAGAYNRTRGLWHQQRQPSFGPPINEATFDKSYGETLHCNPHQTSQDLSRFWGGSPVYPTFPSHGMIQPQRVFSGPSSSSASTCSFFPRPSNEQLRNPQAPGLIPRRSLTQGNRLEAFPMTHPSSWGGFSPGSPLDVETKPSSPTTRPPSTFQPIGVFQMPQYHARTGTTALSPTATEFTTTSSSETPWTSSPSRSSLQTYISPLEPLNYRRLLDKNVSCDWKYIVEKIVCNNDQQASIFLQQKLKVGTMEQKYDIIEAIVNQAYPLMVNRFGNFLVQRCFEHGTPEQVIAIANSIRGNTLSLSMDPFGCHVIQKAFDCVPEENKSTMVHELLRRIPETVVHRYACHVWQKLFELRWDGEPPQIMAKVNEALHGMWHEVAQGETGSLVVQNIFENCVEEEKVRISNSHNHQRPSHPSNAQAHEYGVPTNFMKRPAVEEVLEKIDVLAHGQFGNWCIQHICEHGAPHDKSRAIEHVLHFAVDYSMDQFASKIVEKCLKIGGAEFLERYLSRVCTGRADRPRMPLIDIAGDQYGNYLIQWILMNAAPHQRELVASHIRKHMVSLRGSKFGSRVAMLCCNPSHATRPGPGTGIQVGRLHHFNEDRYSTAGNNGARFNRGSQWGSSYAPFR